MIIRWWRKRRLLASLAKATVSDFAPEKDDYDDDLERALRVRNIVPLDGYRLAVEFSDGTSGIADLSQHVKRAPFQALIDEHMFREARVEHGAVEWPSAEVGIATEALYAIVKRGEPSA